MWYLQANKQLSKQFSPKLLCSSFDMNNDCSTARALVVVVTQWIHTKNKSIRNCMQCVSMTVIQKKKKRAKETTHREFGLWRDNDMKGMALRDYYTCFALCHTNIISIPLVAVVHHLFCCIAVDAAAVNNRQHSDDSKNCVQETHRHSTQRSAPEYQQQNCKEMT